MLVTHFIVGVLHAICDLDMKYRYLLPVIFHKARKITNKHFWLKKNIYFELWLTVLKNVQLSAQNDSGSIIFL